MPSRESNAASLSTWLSTCDKVTALCDALGRPVSICSGEQGYLDARNELASQGLTVTIDGTVAFTDVLLQRYCACPWATEMPVQKLLDKFHAATGPCFGSSTRLHGRIMRGLEAIDGMNVYEAADLHHKTLLLSGGGPGTGKLFHNFPVSGKYYMPDAHFRVVLLSRLGLLRPPAGAVCQIPQGHPEAAPDVCGSCLDSPLVHPFLCKAGPCRLRPHRSLCNGLAIEARAAGGHVDAERACPQLYQWHNDRCQEAILDLVYHLPGTTVTRMIDVTVRCPFASRYASTHARPAVAASAGEHEKGERYGLTVWPLSFESFGRLGPQSILNLHNISGDFIRPASQRTSMGVYNRLRHILEYTLLFEQADLTLVCLGTASGLHGWQQRRHQHSTSWAEGG